MIMKKYYKCVNSLKTETALTRTSVYFHTHQKTNNRKLTEINTRKWNKLKGENNKQNVDEKRL